MLHLNDSNRQFTVSLDSFDMRYMSQYVENARGEKNDKKKLLWAKSVSKEPDFFEVQIISDDEFMKNNSFNEQYKSLPCYICNIDVPQKFYKKHSKSKIHQNYIKLAGKFLENVSKQMNIDIDNIYNHVENDMFFCEICCMVVSEKYKKEHENSNYHFKSIDRQELTTKFLAMYNSDNDFQNDAESGNDYEVTTGSECNSVFVTEDSDNSKGYYSKNTKAESKSLNDNQNRNRPNSTKEDAIRTYLHNVNDNTNYTSEKHALVEKLQDRLLDFNTADNKNNNDFKTQEEKLNEYDKHFSIFDGTQLNCLVCFVPVPNCDRNIIQHVEGSFHRNRSASLLRDNYIDKVSESRYYCYLCIKYTNNFIKHIDTNGHKKELGKGPISKILLREFVYEDPNSKNPVTIHCRQQYKDELKRNKIIRTENSSFYCEVCIIHLSRISEIDHMCGERHRINMEDYVKRILSIQDNILYT